MLLLLARWTEKVCRGTKSCIVAVAVLAVPAVSMIHNNCLYYCIVESVRNIQFGSCLLLGTEYLTGRFMFNTGRAVAVVLSDISKRVIELAVWRSIVLVVNIPPPMLYQAVAHEFVLNRVARRQ